jgi:hypothetical protein
MDRFITLTTLVTCHAMSLKYLPVEWAALRFSFAGGLLRDSAIVCKYPRLSFAHRFSRTLRTNEACQRRA